MLQEDGVQALPDAAGGDCALYLRGYVCGAEAAGAEFKDFLLDYRQGL